MKKASRLMLILAMIVIVCAIASAVSAGKTTSELSSQSWIPEVFAPAPADARAGDVNGDGKVNIRDSALILQYIAGHDVECVNAAIDANGDEEINFEDAEIILKNITGWENAELKLGDSCLHLLSHTPAATATCAADGCIEYWTCSVCGKIFKDETATVVITEKATVKIVEHVEGDWITDKEASYTENGTRHTECTVCGKTLRTETLYLTPSEGLAYASISNGTAYTVCGIGNCTDIDIIVPDTYMGLPVTAIDACAFANCTTVKSIIIPDSVTLVSTRAFENCNNLESVKLPEGITSIEDYTFYGCSSLKSVNIPNNITSIGYGAFSDCKSLTSIVIPDGVISIGYAAFYECSGITNVSIPDSVTSIGDFAFSFCDNLKQLSLGNGILSIGYCAFQNNFKLTEVVIPNSVANIDYGAFANCFTLTKFVFLGTEDEWNSVTKAENWSGQDNFTVSFASYALSFELNSDNNSYTVTGIGNCTDENVNIPSIYEGLPVTAIGNYAFVNCTEIKSITIPNGITKIGEGAFSACAGLTSLKIPASVTEIGNLIISNCPAIKTLSVAFGNKVYHSVNNCIIKTEGGVLVVGCQSSVIPDDGSVTSIGAFAFANNTVISEIKIPSAILSIDDSAFFNCAELSRIILPDSVKSIGNSAFASCSKLAYFVFCGGNEEWASVTLGTDWMANSAFTEVIIHGYAHTEVETPAVAPTCSSTGLTEGVHCSVCYMVIAAQTEIPALPHTVVIIPYVAPTCYLYGSTEGSYCSVCNAIIVQSFSILPVPHTEIVVDPATAPTCVKPGKTEGSHCSVCDATVVEQQDTGEALGHTGEDICTVCGEILVIPSKYKNETLGTITTEDTVIMTEHLKFNLPANIYVMDNFVNIINTVTSAMQTVSGMTFEGNHAYYDYLAMFGEDSYTNVSIQDNVTPNASAIGGAIINSSDMTDFYAIIHETSHMLQYRQSWWHYCRWAMESISTYTTYKTAVYIAENHPELTVLVDTPYHNIFNLNISDYSKLYEHPMEYWMENTFEYSGNQNYSIGFRFAWFLDEVYGDYTKWIFEYEEYNSYLEANVISDNLPIEEQVKAFKMAYGDNVFEEFYAWLKVNEYKFEANSHTDMNEVEKINIYPQFMAEEWYDINCVFPKMTYSDLIIDMTAGHYYLTEYKGRSIDQLKLTVRGEGEVILGLYDQDGKLMRTEIIYNSATLDISGVYYVKLIGEGTITRFDITGY